jgi:predicted Zn-dependent protease
LSFLTRSYKKTRTSLEISIGKSTKESLIKQFGLYKNAQASYMVKSMGKKISAQASRPDIDYDFTVLDSKEVNAFAAPGGFVFVTRGLLEKIENENQLAFVIGHEVGHIARKHSIKAIERTYGLSVLLSLFSREDSNSKNQIARIASSLALLKRSRKNEFEADWQGIHLADKAGYNPNGAIGFFNVLKSMEGKGFEKIERVASFFSTHPPTSERIKSAAEHINEIHRK